MHVGAYGEQLGVSHIVIPHSARRCTAPSASITSDIAHEDQITHPLRAPFDEEAVAGIYRRLEEKIVGQLADEGFERGDMRLQRAIDMRYRRQVHIVTVPVADSGGPITESLIERTIAGFESLYEEKYGPQSAYREAGIELVSFRLRGEGVVRKPSSAPRRWPTPTPRTPSSAACGRGSTRTAPSRTCPATTSSGSGRAT